MTKIMYFVFCICYTCTVQTPFVGHFNLHIAIEWPQWSYLNGATNGDCHGANGDCHWCQWRWGAPLMPLRPSPLEPMDRHWYHFLLPLGPMPGTPNRYDPLPLDI